MKKFLTAFAVITAFFPLVFAEYQPLMPASFVEVVDGNLAENTLLASDEGGVFIEFSKDTKFVDAEAQVNFTGEILPPHKIELEDVKNPRGLMRELITFEMVSNSGADILFIDKFDKRTRKNLFREQLLNPDGLKKSAWVKLVYLIEDENVKLPNLWEWQGEEDGWRKIGGNVAESGENSRVLTSVLRRTGIYTIFDEDPEPEHFADEYEVYPKRPYTGPYADEIEGNPASGEIGSTADFSVEGDGEFAINNFEDENFARFHSSGEPPLIEATSEEEIPSVQAQTELDILKELEKKVRENPAKLKANPEMEKKYNDLVQLLKDASIKKQKIDTLNAELNNVSLAISRAQDENEKANLEKTFLDLQTNLYKVQKEAKETETQYLTLKEEVDDFFAGISLAETAQANSFENQETEESEPPYIPENATLVKSGADEVQDFSWKFPVFLLVCFGLLGWGIWSAQKKEEI